MSVALPDADATERLGQRIAGLLVAGDLVLLTGDLGAGKTTLTRGIGAGLGVRGPVTSPTFVVAREHPPLADGPGLVHVDLYRVGTDAEIDDLDLASSDAVTVVEWGAGRAEHLGDSRLEITLEEPEGGGRVAVLRGLGARWQGVSLEGVSPEGVSPEGVSPEGVGDP